MGQRTPSLEKQRMSLFLQSWRRLSYKEQVGEGVPRSGDLTSLTTEPNGIGTPITRPPHSRDAPLRSSLPWTSSNQQHVHTLHPNAGRWKQRTARSANTSPRSGGRFRAARCIWPFGRKQRKVTPGGQSRSHSPTRSHRRAQPRVPIPLCLCVCACVCECVWGGNVGVHACVWKEDSRGLGPS